jgi:hypothetical protein
VAGEVNKDIRNANVAAALRTQGVGMTSEAIDRFLAELQSYGFVVAWADDLEQCPFDCDSCRG